MKYAYYPGCTLKSKGKNLEEYALKCAEVLGFDMCEIDDWQCCGGCYSTAKDEIATKLASVRALAFAKDKNEKLLTLCSACHNVIKRVNADMKNDKVFNSRVNEYMKDQLASPYNGETQVIHYLEVLRDEIGFEKIKEKVIKPLAGKKIGGYYGCLLLRPSDVMAFDNPENPTVMEDLISVIGGTPVKYGMRNECCGAYCALEDKNIPKKRAGKIIANAVEAGVEILVTACPLCAYNLRNNADGKIEVKYFTELLAEAFGVK